MVSLLTCLIWTERGSGSSRVREDLQGPLRSLQDIARRIGKTAQDCGLEVTCLYNALTLP
jgi:ATP-dependent RNA helicase DOB1